MGGQNTVGKVCKITSIFSGALSFIGWFIMGANSNSVELMICGWLGTFIFCLILYALGEIINQLTITNEIKRVSEPINQTVSSSSYDNSLFGNDINKSESRKKIEREAYLLYSKKKLPIDYTASIDDQRKEIRKIVDDKIAKL